MCQKFSRLRVEDDLSEFEEATDKELSKPDMQEKASEEKKKKRDSEKNVFVSEREEQIKLSDVNGQINVHTLLKENGTVKHGNGNKEKMQMEKTNEYGSKRNIKEADEDLCCKEFALKENKCIRLRKDENEEDELGENQNFEELSKKVAGKEIEKPFALTGELTFERITQSRNHYDRLENAPSDYTPENTLLTRRHSPAEANQEFLVSSATQDTDHGE